MKTIILLITLVLCNLSFSCEILHNGKYIPCYTNIEEIIFEHEFKRFGGDKVLIENEKIISNIEYNVKLAESRLNESEVKYVESIKKYKTTKNNADSQSFIKQKAYYEMIIAKQKAYSEMLTAKQKAYYEMLTAKREYEKARRECGKIYALAKGESNYLPVGKSPSEIFKLIK